ncbi:MAG TPA: hypothetical protein VK474_09725 [Chthoniobacterales bacterium]|nr:hypothetical protein [Chthoniobacterales bacterium]
MKQSRLPAQFLCLLLGLTPLGFVQAQGGDFPGVEKAMPPQSFEQAGLNKLTPEERAQLDDFIRRYVATSNEKAATVAIDKAVKENKVKVNVPEIIQSNIVGTFSGYNGRSRFTLENGQVWAQSQQVSRAYPRIESPPVLITKGQIGYRMFIAGGGNIRVSKIR